MKLNKAFLIGMLISLIGTSSYFIKKEVQSHSIKTGINAVYSNDSFDIEQEKKAIQYLSDKGFDQISFNIRYFQESDTSSKINLEPIPSFKDLSLLIHEAHKRKLNVILRPLVDSKIKQSRHLFNPGNPDKWFLNYSLILENLETFSKKENVERLEIGVELDNILIKFPKKFNELAKNSRKIYDGKISYAIGIYQEDSLLIKTASSLNIDFLGIDYYVPLQNQEDTLIGFENNYYLSKILSHAKKPVVFSEVGYRSIGNAGKSPWDHERKSGKNFSEQKSLYSGFFIALSKLKREEKKKIESVSFWIKDKVNFSQDLFESDTLGYSPFGKPAEKIILDYNLKRKFFKNYGLIK